MKKWVEIPDAGHDNVLVTHTFSKIYGLAGERVGWGTGATHLVVARPVIAAANPVMAAAQVAIPPPIRARVRQAGVDWVRRSMTTSFPRDGAKLSHAAVTDTS